MMLLPSVAPRNWFHGYAEGWTLSWKKKVHSMILHIRQWRVRLAYRATLGVLCLVALRLSQHYLHRQPLSAQLRENSLLTLISTNLIFFLESMGVQILLQHTRLAVEFTLRGEGRPRFSMGVEEFLRALAGVVFWNAQHVFMVSVDDAAGIRW